MLVGTLGWSKPRWLEESFRIWKSWPGDRDYLLPKPSPDLCGIVRRKASYADSASCSRALLGSLMVPRRTSFEAWTMIEDLDDGAAGNRWEKGDKRLIPDAGLNFWT